MSLAIRFATHADLKSVPLKIISSLSAVPERVLDKMNELQKLQPEQFEELGLPLAIKHLAWEKDSVLFVRIVSPHADKYLASEFSPKMVLSSQQLRFYRSLDTIKRRKLMGPERINALAEYTGGRPILIGFLCDYIAERFSQENSLSEAGLWATLLTDVLVTAREHAYGSIADQSVDRLCALASRLDLAVREDVFNDGTVRDVQRLFRLATGIGEGQHEPGMVERREAKQEEAKQKDGSTKIQKTLKTAWSLVSKMDKNKWFKDPVTEAIAEGYHKVIKTPMDLGTILKKIKGGGYPSFGDFDRDLKLMWQNCRTYNGEGTQYNKEALRQEEEWSKISAKIENDLRHQETRPGGGGGGGAAPTATTPTNSNKRKSGSGSGGSSQDDARGSGGGGGGGAALAPMAQATQLERDGIGRRVGLASVLLAEPFAAKLMYRHASERIPEVCCERGILPRDHPVYAPLVQLLDLGESARHMLRANTFGVREVKAGVTRAVLPCVVALHARAAAAAGRRRAGGGADDADGASAAETAAEKEEDAAATAGQDWRGWYSDVPAIRRLVCTMLCRAMVRGSDEAAGVLMPAAKAAVKRMADQRWLWASLGELVQRSADASAAAVAAAPAKDGGGVVAAGVAGKKGGKEKGAVPRVLKPETLLLVLELFSTGLELALVTDAVFIKALELVAGLLPLASPPPPPAVDTAAAAAVASGGDKSKPKPSAPGKGAVAALLPRSALEDVVNQAAARAARPPRRPLSEAEELRAKEAFAKVFAKSPPGWANKVSEYRAKLAEKSRKGGAGKVVGGGDGGKGGGGGDGGSGSAGRPSRPISIKGPKRGRQETGGGGDEGVDDAASRKKKSRRVNV
ncbi:conserved unknown protein [Ectocarpus siliculosus]|uniref:Bromo domain-containing protein n=1 Tax=Ectocarpus siliculosus TaxID=2880 RepID=D7FZE7_ECTSI|nr:conserved unknown protein [Ectocarpus siliculosus]|eukprot:CBJ32764.1 conserved unknown protein [Ectocarpus siliculosus]